AEVWLKTGDVKEGSGAFRQGGVREFGRRGDDERRKDDERQHDDGGRRAVRRSRRKGGARSFIGDKR
ncbi:hypothetical protein V5799_024450, partial [Amblyomma americanum]